MEKLVKEHAREIFGEDCIYFDIKYKLKSKHGIISIPDGYIIKLSKPYAWYIVEVELSTHPIYDHIVAQLSKFISGIENYSTQKEIVNAIFNEIDANKVLRIQIEEKIGTSEIHRFLTKLISKLPQIIVIIDKANGVKEACSVLKQDVRIIEFKIFKREDAPTVHAYLFTPLYETRLIETIKIHKMSGAVFIQKIKRDLERGKRSSEYCVEKALWIICNKLVDKNNRSLNRAEIVEELIKQGLAENRRKAGRQLSVLSRSLTLISTGKGKSRLSGWEQIFEKIEEGVKETYKIKEDCFDIIRDIVLELRRS